MRVGVLHLGDAHGADAALVAMLSRVRHRALHRRNPSLLLSSDMTAGNASLMILIAGPYRSGTGDDPARMEANVRVMERYALPLYRAGHIPVVGEWFALPLVALAGSQQVGDAAFNEIFHPIAERLLARCDGVLRVGGTSAGADLMVDVARTRGLQVFHALHDVPGCENAEEP